MNQLGLPMVMKWVQGALPFLILLLAKVFYDHRLGKSQNNYFPLYQIPIVDFAKVPPSLQTSFLDFMSLLLENFTLYVDDPFLGAFLYGESWIRSCAQIIYCSKGI